MFLANFLPSEFSPRILKLQVVFLLTGLAQTFANQYLVYSGLGSGSSRGVAILILPYYLGAMMTYFLEGFSLTPIPKEWKFIALAGSVDVISNSACIIGLALAGSGVFQVAYSFVIVYSAVLSKVVLGREISFVRWVCLGVITYGVNSLAKSVSGGSDGGDGNTENNVLLGMVFTLVGALLNAINYTISDYALSLPQAVSPTVWCFYQGLCSATLTIVYIVACVAPVWYEVVVEPVVLWDGIYGTFLVQLFASFLHMWSYFLLIQTTGAVSTGVLNALRSAFVFLLSAAMFCSSHSEQCLTLQKSLASLVIIGAVILYSYAPASSPPFSPSQDSLRDVLVKDARV